MIFSPKHKVAFYHIMKTAGSSVKSLVVQNDSMTAMVGRVHDRAAFAFGVMGAARWNEYLTFTVVRHPADRLLSYYAWLVKHRPINFPNGVEPLSEWLLKPSLASQDAMLDAPVNLICRFENLAADIAALSARVGWEATSLVHINESKHEPWQQTWTADELRLIEDRYSADYERFGYSKSTL